MISFIFPVYKQEHVLRRSIVFLEEFLRGKPGETYEIIICIDGSPDACRSIADALATEYANIVVTGYEKNKGRGYALKFAGLTARGEYLMCMDCDLVCEQYLPYFDKMMAEIHAHDIVIASRFHPAARTRRKALRRFVSVCHRGLVRIFFRDFKVTDPDVGFKAFRKDVFEKTNLVTNLNGPSWDLQFLVNAVQDGCDVFEFPFHYVEDYDHTTVNVLYYSVVEFVGILYIFGTKLLGSWVRF